MNYLPLIPAAIQAQKLFTLSSAGPGGIWNCVSSGPEPSLFPGPGSPAPRPEGDSRGAWRLLTPV